MNSKLTKVINFRFLNLFLAIRFLLLEVQLEVLISKGKLDLMWLPKIGCFTSNKTIHIKLYWLSVAIRTVNSEFAVIFGRQEAEKSSIDSK